MTKRVEELLDRMTLEEQVSLLAGRNIWETVPIERLDIPRMRVSDGPAGVRGTKFDGPASMNVPCGTAIAASWNRTLVRRIGELLGREDASVARDFFLGALDEPIRLLAFRAQRLALDLDPPRRGVGEESTGAKVHRPKRKPARLLGGHVHLHPFQTGVTASFNEARVFRGHYAPIVNDLDNHHCLVWLGRHKSRFDVEGDFQWRL